MGRSDQNSRCASGVIRNIRRSHVDPIAGSGTTPMNVINRFRHQVAANARRLKAESIEEGGEALAYGLS